MHVWYRLKCSETLTSSYNFTLLGQKCWVKKKKKKNLPKPWIRTLIPIRCFHYNKCSWNTVSCWYFFFFLRYYELNLQIITSWPRIDDKIQKVWGELQNYITPIKIKEAVYTPLFFGGFFSSRKIKNFLFHKFKQTSKQTKLISHFVCVYVMWRCYRHINIWLTKNCTFLQIQ